MLSSVSARAGRLRPRLSIRTGVAALVLASVLPLVGGLVYTIRAARANADADARAASAQLATLVAANIRQFIVDSRTLMQQVAGRPLVDELRSGTCDPLLRLLTRLHPDYANIGVIDLAGRVRCSSVSTNGPVSVAGSAWFEQAQRTHRFTVGDPFYGPITHRWVSVLALPLREHDAVVGYLALPVDLVNYQKHLRRVGASGNELTGVFDRREQVVVRSRSTGRYVGHSLPDFTHGQATNGTLVDSGGVDRIVGFAPVAGTDWTAYAGAPTSTALARGRSLTYTALGAGLASLVLAALVALALSRGITRPIRRLAAAARRVGEGETDERVPVEGPAEIALAAEQFNTMVESRLAAEEEQRRLAAHLAHSQKLESMGRLAGGVAHDLNNMLVVIGGYASLLRGRATSRDEAEPLDEIAAAAERAGSLTRQLLAFGRLQNLEPTVLDLNALVSQLERMLGRLLGDDVELALALDPALARVEADRGQLEQVITNLVVNASDALPTGGQIAIRTALVSLDGEAHALGLEPGRYVHLCVADNGVGMDEETRARAFEPFFTTKAPGHGTGLGLASAYGVISQTGGAVQLNSSPGAGTSVCIYLPAVESELEEAAPAAHVVERGAGERVLLVEDEPAVRDLFGTLLANLGYRVRVAASGVEALELAADRAEPFDVVVTDVAMPGIGGWELAGRLGAAGIETPVLFVSGYAPEPQPGPTAGRSGFLQKPFSRAELAARLRSLIDGE